MKKNVVKRMLMLLVILTMLTSSVYADFSISDFYPPTGEKLYTGKFDDGEIDKDYVTAIGDIESGNFSVYEDVNSKALVMCSGSKIATASTVAFWPGGNAPESGAGSQGTGLEIKDHIVISFDISRYAPSGKKLDMEFRLRDSSTERTGPKLSWKDSDLTFTAVDKTTTTVDLTPASDADSENYHNFAIVVDSTLKGALYIDGELVKENIQMKDSSGRGTHINRLFFTFGTSGYDNQVVRIKNLEIYSSTPTDITKDVNGLTVGSLTTEAADASGVYVLTQNLNLPKTGAGGGIITWTSSNENIISSDGIIVRHSGYEKSEAVILTAKIVNGNDEVSKNFTFYVKRKDFPVTTDVDGDYIVYDDFSNSNLTTEIQGSHPHTEKIENGKYVFESSGGEVNCELHFQPDKADLPTTGKYVLEYDFSLSNDARYVFELRNDDGKRFIQWQKDREKNYIYNTNLATAQSSAQQMSDVGILSPNEEVHFKYLIDMDNKQYSLYVDGALLAKEAYKSHANAGYATVLGCIRSISYSSLEYNVTFDNLKLYKLADGAAFAPVSNTKTISLNGDNVSEITASGTYAAKLNITDFDANYGNDTDFIVALYNKNTRELESVKIVKAQELKATFVSGSTENYGLYAKTTINVPADYDNYYIKLMHWNGNIPISVSDKVD